MPEMNEQNLIQAYNYDAFVPEKFERWLNFSNSFPLGVKVPDFPLWRLDETRTSLLDALRQHRLIFVEFGSFT